MLKQFLQLLLIGLCFSASNLTATQCVSTECISSITWTAFNDVNKTSEIMTAVSAQLPENVRYKLVNVVALESGQIADRMLYRVLAYYPIGDIGEGAMELTIVERWRKLGRITEPYYSVASQDRGVVSKDIITAPNQQFSHEESTVTDARKIAEVMLQVSPMLDLPTRDRVENVVEVTGRMEGDATIFHMRVHYAAGDFWQGTIELTITEQPQRVGRQWVNTYHVNAKDLGAE